MDRQPPFFRPGGTMDPNAPSYLERAADAQLLDALVACEYVFLLDSRQKGKSSLVARTMVKLKELGIDTVKLDLQRIGANVTPDQWYAGLAAGLGQELGLTQEIFDYWGAHREIGPLARWIGALETIVLARNDHRIVIFIDEVDFVRALPFPTDEFFAGIRDCYNRRSEVRGFERLSFCLVGVATPGQLIRNPEITPFNIGTRIDLSDFTLDETQAYAKALSQGSRDGEQLTKRIHYWVNGHPYLTQLLCSQVASHLDVTAPHHVDKLVNDLFFTPESRMREPNLADVERRMLDPDVPGMSLEERKTQVLALYGRLLRGKGVDVSEENPVVVSLRLAGIGLEDRGNLRVRNRIYKTVFNEGWRQQSFPHAELRRMRGATRLATLRTAAVAAVALIAVSIGAAGIYNIAKEREQALKTLSLRSKELQQQNYVGLMANLRLAISENQWAKVSNLIRTSRDNPLRGWEWGHAAMFVTRYIAEHKIPSGLTFEKQPNGALFGISAEEEYEFTSTGVRFVRKHPDTHFKPMFRFGNIRCGSDPTTGAYTFQNINTGEILGKALLRHIFFDFDPKSRTILGTMPGGNGDPFELLSIDGSQSLGKIAAPTYCIAARFLPDGTIISIHQGGLIRRQDRHGTVLASVKGPDIDMIQWGRLTLSQDGKYFVFSDRRYRHLEFRRTSDLSLVSTTAGPLLRTSCISFSFDGSKCVAGTSDGGVFVFDVKSGSLINTFVGHWLGLNTVVFLRGDQHVFSMDSGVNVRTWAVDAPQAIQVYQDHKQQAEAPFLVNKGSSLLSRSPGWQGTQELVSRNLITGNVNRCKGWEVAQVLDGSVFVSFANGSMERLNVDTLRVERQAKIFEKVITTILAYDSGRRLFVQEYRGEVGVPSNCAILDANTLAVQSRFQLKWPAGTRFDYFFASNMDGVNLGVGALTYDTVTGKSVINAVIYVISGLDGRILNRLQTDGPISAMQFTPDGKSLVLGRHDPGGFATTPTVIDVSTMKQTRTLPPGTSRTSRYTFDPSGRYLAGTSGAVFASLWDFQEGRLVASLAPGGGVRTLSFSPDGTRIVTGATNRTTTIWDTKTGDELFSLRYTPLRKDDQSGDALNDSSIFSPDGTKVIMACTDGAVRIFNSIPWKAQDNAARK